MRTAPDEIDLAMTRSVQHTGRPQPLDAVGRRGQPVRVQVCVHRSGYVVLKAVDFPRDASDSEPVREWLRSGEIRFASTHEAADWLRRHVVRTEPPPPAPVPAPPSVDSDEVARLAAAGRLAPSSNVQPEAVLSLLCKQVFGQHHVLAPLAEHAARHIARQHPRRPATWMFLGPTGVGKTATALALGRSLTELLPRGAGFAVTRLDCAELGESHRRSQLFGAPQGYIGHGDGAQLLDDLAANPRRLVLFDEVEKAHPSVLLSVMAAMDAGRVTSPARTSSGSRDIDCRQTIFIFTSNAEAEAVTGELEERNGFEDRAVVDEVCRRRLRAFGLSPELVGRICAFFPFRRLTARAETDVVALAVRNVAAEYGIDVTRVDPGVVAAVLNRTRGQVYGARPIEYVVDELLGSAFAETQGSTSGPVHVRTGPPVRCEPVAGENDCSSA